MWNICLFLTFLSLAEANRQHHPFKLIQKSSRQKRSTIDFFQLINPKLRSQNVPSPDKIHSQNKNKNNAHHLDQNLDLQIEDSDNPNGYIKIKAGDQILDQVTQNIDGAVLEATGLDFDTFKNLGITTGPAIQNIVNYGCWCYFEENHGMGRGSPVDAVDAHCKTLHLAYECAMKDYHDETGLTDCVPWHVDYNAGVGSQGLDEIVHTCRKVNPDNLCSQYACMSEGVFVINMIRTFLALGSVKPEHQVSNGFDYESRCNLGPRPTSLPGPGLGEGDGANGGNGSGQNGDGDENGDEAIRQ